MLNGDLASQLIGLVRQATTKPIRSLVNTSYHGESCLRKLRATKTKIASPSDTSRV
jgi:hypothetical protein